METGECGNPRRLLHSDRRGGCVPQDVHMCGQQDILFISFSLDGAWWLIEECLKQYLANSYAILHKSVCFSVSQNLGFWE